MKSYSRDQVEDLLTKVRDQIKDVIETNAKFENNFYLYRWLIHYHMKVDRVERAIRESLVWRNENNIDILAEQDWASESPGLEKELNFHIGGITKDGKPLITLIADGVDMRKIIQKYGKENFRRFFYQWHVKLEKLMLDHYKEGTGSNVDLLSTTSRHLSKSDSACGNIDQSGKSKKTLYNPAWYEAAPVQLVSFRNFAMWNVTYLEGLGIFVDCANVGFKYFPCSVSAVYCVNLNKFSNTFVNLMKPIITSQSYILEFHDSDKNKWSQVLMTDIEKDQLLQFFGGTKSVM